MNRSDNDKPYRYPQRRDPSAERDFIIRAIRELEQVGDEYKNNAAGW